MNASPCRNSTPLGGHDYVAAAFYQAWTTVEFAFASDGRGPGLAIGNNFTYSKT